MINIISFPQIRVSGQMEHMLSWCTQKLWNLLDWLLTSRMQECSDECHVSHGLTYVAAAHSSYWTFIKLSKKSGATLHWGCAKYTRGRTLKKHDTVSKQLIWLWMQPSHMQPRLTSSSVCTIKANLLIFHTLQLSSNYAWKTRSLQKFTSSGPFTNKSQLLK